MLPPGTPVLKMTHDHAHDHNHHHHISHYNRAFAVGVLLNAGFVAVELGFGISAKSLALIADAGHNLSDVLSLLLAWGAGLLGARAATEKRTYGYRKATVMASLASAIMILVALGGIVWETVHRFMNPQPVESRTIIVVAAIGVIINTITALLFISGQKHDLNLRAAFLHMAADAAVSLGVVIAGITIMFTGWWYVDPAISIVIVLVILAGTWSLLADSMNLAIDSVPKNIDIAEIKRYLTSIDEVSQIHDLHVWPMSTTEVALSVHLVIGETNPKKGLLTAIQQELLDHFHIAHSTIQIEGIEDESCMLDKHRCI